MSVTLNSATSSYLSVANLLIRVDARWIADLVSDTGSRVAVDSLATNATLLGIIKGACGELESVCAVGRRYDKAALTTIAASGTMAAELMLDILSDLTVRRLWRRRPDKGNPPGEYQRVEEHLQKLRDGERIFSTSEHQEAGLVQSRVPTPRELNEKHFAYREASRFFGPRSEDRP